MSKKQIFRLVAGGILVLFFSLNLFAGDALIDWPTTHQNIDGFGACSAWSGSAMPVAIADLLFRTDASNIGLSIYRTRIPPNSTMTGEIASVQQALARNSNIIVWAAPWSPPAAMKNSNNVNTGMLLPANYQAYANYLTKYVKDIYNNYGISLYALSVQNESDFAPLTYEGCTWTAQELHDFIMNNLGPALSASSPSCKIMMPEAFGDSLALSDTTLNDANAAKYVGIVGEHLYGLPGNEPHAPYPYPLAVSLGKQYWETEYYNNHLSSYDTGMTEGLNTAVQMHNSLCIAEFNAYHYWWMISTGADNGGLLPSGCATVACAPKTLYCFGNFSKFIRPGYVRIDTTLIPTAGVYVSAYKLAATGEFVIVAINSTAAAVNQKFNLNAMTTTTVTPWITDATNSLVQLISAAVSAGSFTYNLPANSVISFVGASGNITVTPTFTPTVTPIPSSYILDTCEDGDNTNNLGGSWYDYRDAASTINPDPFVMTAGGYTGSANYMASITGNIAASGYGGMGTNFNAAGTAVDMTGYIGVEFYVKGSGSYWFQVTQQTSVGSPFGKAFTASSTWTKVTVMFNTADMTQRYGGPDVFTLSQAIALQWANNADGVVDLQVDNIKLLMPAAASPTNTPSYTVTVSATQTVTSAQSKTFTPSFTLTGTQQATPSVSPVNTATVTSTFTRTVTNSPVNTRTPSPTFTETTALTMAAGILFCTDRTGDIEIFSRLAVGIDTDISNNGAGDYNPNVSHDGQYAAFSSNRTGEYQIYKMKLSDNSVTRLTNNTASEWDPAFNPSDTKVVFKSTRDDALGDIFIMDADGTSQTNLTAARAATEEWDPDFSRDGAQIVFTSRLTAGDPASDEIFIMNSDGSNVRRLTNNSIPDWYPSCSPAVDKILFVSKDGLGLSDNVYTMNFDGSAVTKLTTMPGDNDDPYFSPDGTQIIFINNNSGAYDMYIMNADGTNTTVVEINASNEICPVYLRPVYTPTPTQTPGPTFTITASFTGTPTQTVSPSPAMTPSVSVTASPSITLTPGVTGTFTITPQSPTITATNTSTLTATGTASVTVTATYTRTVTLSRTETVLPSDTLTPTSTYTFTPTIAVPSATMTPVAAATVPVTDDIVYPNPVNPVNDDAKVRLRLDTPADDVIFRIYSTGFRFIREVRWGSLPAGYYTGIIDRSYLKTLSNGIYYYRIEVNYTGKAAEKLKIRKLMIIRQL